MKILFYISFVLFFSCGKKEEGKGCTSQNTNSNRIVISCKTKRVENPSTCARMAVNQSASDEEICQLGFDINCAPAKILPSAIKGNLDNGSLVLINKENGKRLRLQEVSTSSDTFLILQQEGDGAGSSSVSLPVCQN